MKKIWRCLLLALSLAISQCLAAGAVVDGKASEVASGAGMPERQLLVMLHMAPPHFRPDVHYFGGYSDDSGHSARHRIAEDIARKHGLKLVSDWPMPVLGVDCYVMEAPASESPARIADLLANDSRIEWVQLLSLYHSLGNADPLYSVQPSAKYWHVAEIHKRVTGHNVIVAVIDSGIEEDHPDLTGQVKLKENFIDGNPYVPELHGTAVAGIIAAKAGNGIGIEGVAPGAHLMALRACWQEPDHVTRCSSFTLGKALNFAIMHKAQVINLSLTGPPDRLLQRLLDAAITRGITIVGAADPHYADGGFPASYPGVLAITDEDFKEVAAGTLTAPGHDIPTTAPGGRWSFVSGPSYAAAHVSGMIALLTELRPSFTPSQIRQELVVDHIASIDGRAAGEIDACATIARSLGTCLCLCPVANASKAIH